MNTKSDANARTTDVRIGELRTEIERLIEANDHGSAYELTKVKLPLLEDQGIITRPEAAELLLDVQQRFFVRHDYGLATEIVKAASGRFLDVGLCDEAAEAYYSFADKLFENREYGWAGSEYYNAALIFIRNGMVEKARAYLARALHRFEKLPREFWTNKLKAHLEILKPTTSTNEKLSQLSQLQMEFRNMSRDNWVEACNEGSRRLVDEGSKDRQPV